MLSKEKEISDRLITCLNEYNDYLYEINKYNINSHIIGGATFYRGQANIEWGLSPGLYREGLFNHEQLLITELMHLNPSEFEGLSRFHILSKMQHFGLPTRLLDISQNPLVALFFACYGDEQLSKDGAVYIMPNVGITWSTDTNVQIIMDYVFEFSSFPTHVNLSNILPVLGRRYQDIVGMLIPETISSLIHSLTLNPLAVLPAHTNPRIIAQSGAFLLCSMICQQTESPNSKMHYGFSAKEIASVTEITEYGVTARIPSECKSEILSQLDAFGISVHRLFPDLEHQAQYVKNMVKTQLNEYQERLSLAKKGDSPYLL